MGPAFVLHLKLKFYSIVRFCIFTLFINHSKMNNIRFFLVFFTIVLFTDFCFAQVQTERDSKQIKVPEKILFDVFTPDQNPKEDLCTPEYSNGCGMGDGFVDFAVAEIENYNSGCNNLNGEAWSQFLELGPAIMFPGATYDFIMKTGYDDQNVSIWIDFNDDFELTEDEMILYDFVLEESGQQYTAQVTIPMTPYLGMHYMRARTNWGGSCDDPCASYGYGEAEDYYVIIGDAASGSVEGIVTEYTGGTPIAGATITLGGNINYTTITEPDGSFLFDFVFVGEYPISCEKEGYNIFDGSQIIVEEDMTTEVYIELTKPTIDLALSGIDIEIPVNGEYEEPVMVENNGDGPLYWSASIAFLSDNIKDYLDLQFEYPVASGYGEAGIETDGVFIYSTMWNGNQINKYDLEGNFVESFTIEGVFGLRDLAYDGTHFYGAGSAPILYEMDFENKELISSLELSFMVRAIAYNHDEDYFYANNWNTDIMWFDKEGTLLGSFEVGPLGENYYGFAYDNVSFGGPFLWGYAQTSESQNELVQIQLPSGTETGFTLDVTEAISGPVFSEAGGLFTHPNLIYGKWTIGGMIQGEKIWGLELSEAQTWIGLAPYVGTLLAGESQNMNVMLNAIDLIPADYNAEIHFTSYPEVGNPVIDVTMNVVPGIQSPTNLSSIVDCETAELCWDIPNPIEVDSFGVYINGEIFYTEEDCHEIYGPDSYTCYVTTWFLGNESTPSDEHAFEIEVPLDLEPVIFIVDSVIYDMIYMSWQTPEGCAEVTGYNVYRNNVKINQSTIFEVQYADTLLGGVGTFEYYVTGVYGFGESDPSNIETVVLTSINKNLESEFSVFPNPVSGNLFIDVNEIPCKISLTDSQGILLKTKTINTKSSQIDLSSLEPGIYFIKLEAEDSAVFKKVVVE